MRPDHDEPRRSESSEYVGSQDVDKLLSLLRRALANVPHVDDGPTSPHWVESHSSSLEGDGSDDSNIEDFRLFDQRVSTLDQELLSFINVVRQLGSSINLTVCAGEIRNRLVDVKHLFRANIERLVDTKVPASEHVNAASREGSFGPRPTRRKRTSHTRPSLSAAPEIDTLPIKLDGLANELAHFRCYLGEIAEFSDENVDASLRTFEGDLRYWSSNLDGDLKGQLQEPGVRQYLNDLTEEMADHLDSLIDALKRFREVGVPTIQFTQQRQASALQNLSTVATFFSAVNATTIQYSYNLPDTLLARWTNLLWILSLVFSIASAINSQIANHWRSAGYRSPQPHVPKLVSLWMTHTPLLLLGSSVFTFSSGLICFSFEVFGHHLFIPLVTSISTSVTMFALITIGLWIAGERYVGSPPHSRQWLAIIISRNLNQALAFSGLPRVVTWFTEPPSSSRRARLAASWGSLHIDQRLGSFRRYIARIFRFRNRNLPQRPQLSPLMLPLNSPHNIVLSAGDLASPNGALRDSPPFVASALPQVDPGRLSPTEPHVSRPHVPFTFRSAAAAVLMTTVRGRPASFHPPTSAFDMPVKDDEMTTPERLAHIAPIARRLRLKRGPRNHTAFVRHLQFSPDGRYLSTCSWDRTIIIWRIHPSFEVYKVLPHPKNGRVSGLSWSHSGTLLARSYRTIQLWDIEKPECQMIERPHEIQFAKWLPRRAAFVSLEDDGKVYIIDISQSARDITELEFDRLRVHSVDITSDEKWLIAVATVLHSRSGLKPMKSRPEKRIIVYNLEGKAIERQIPVLSSVYDISLSKDNAYALVSFDDGSPPRLYSLQRSRSLRLYFERQFEPEDGSFRYAGPSVLGQVDDSIGGTHHLVMSVSKAGQFIIWDLETGTKLHSFRWSFGRSSASPVAGLMGIAWNPSPPPHSALMLAAGSLDGSVTLLESSLPSVEDQHSPVFGRRVLEPESAMGLENISSPTHRSNDVT